MLFYLFIMLCYIYHTFTCIHPQIILGGNPSQGQQHFQPCSTIFNPLGDQHCVSSDGHGILLLERHVRVGAVCGPAEVSAIHLYPRPESLVSIGFPKSNICHLCFLKPQQQSNPFARHGIYWNMYRLSKIPLPLSAVGEFTRPLFQKPMDPNLPLKSWRHFCEQKTFNDI